MVASAFGLIVVDALVQLRETNPDRFHNHKGMWISMGSGAVPLSACSHASDTTDLRLFISILGPFYYWFIEASSYDQSTGQWSFATTELSPSSQLNRSLERTLDNLSLKGYEEVPRRIARMVVPNVETELKETGAVSVFDCLFTDLVSIAD